MAYRDISRGVRLAADHAKYITWLEKDTAGRQAAYATVNTPANRVKTSRVGGYIVPFTSAGTPLVYMPAKLIAAVQSGRGDGLAKSVRAMLEPFTFTEAEVKALSTPNILEGTKFKPATLTIIQRVTSATDKKASRITGRIYYRHENDSVTGKFGKKLAPETFDTTIAAIKASTTFATVIGETAALVNNKYRFVPEGV